MAYKNYDDESDYDDEGSDISTSAIPTSMHGQKRREPKERGLHIGVHNGVSVHMRVNEQEEAEFNYGGDTWSKSPPPFLPKSKIKIALDTIKSMGVDTSKYEKSLGSVDHYSAPLNMIAEDDIQHSLNIVQTLHEEKMNKNKKKSRRADPSGPIILSNPDYEQYNIL